MTSAGGQTLTTAATRVGTYEFRGLVPGVYSLTVNAPGFAAFTTSNLNIVADTPTRLDISLEIAVKKEQVQVQEQTNTIDVSPENNATSTILKGKDLDALSDDPDELQSDLEALAGPSAGPNGGQIYIDGFTNGTLPPKNAIREIRINQNPFSAQYDRLGYGRIEVFTKPGMDKFHGQFRYEFNDKALNGLNPYVSLDQPPNTPIIVPNYTAQQFSGSFSGPINKKSSFYFDAERRNINDDAVINSLYLTESALVPTPRVRFNITPRVDYQLTPGNTLTVRYQYLQDHHTDDGIGGFSLQSQAYDSTTQTSMAQISDTQILSPRVINETRFQYSRTRSQSGVVSLDGYDPTDPEINVQGYMIAGGNPLQKSADLNNSFELQNYTSMAFGKHFIKFGGRVRSARESTTVSSGSNGIYTFASANCPNLMSHPASPYGVCQGGPPSQYSVTLASPTIHLAYADVGLYAEDDWRIRPNLTISGGLRFESQTELSDHADFAPRIGLSWGLGKGKSTPKTVLRVGWGMFYDRFSQSLVLQQAQGLVREQYFITDPSTLASCYASYPTPCPLSGAIPIPTRYQINPNLRTPYVMQTAVSLERQLGKIGTAALTYLNSRGLHQFFSQDLSPDTSQNLYEYASEGTFKQNQLIANVNLRLASRLSLTSFYVLNYANSDTLGANSFPAVPTSVSADWGRAPFDVRQRAFLGGSWSLPWLIRLSPFVIINAGAPFNIVTGTDLNGDGILSNDRPAFAVCGSAGAVDTNYGCFNVNPLPGQKLIPVNYGHGPAMVSVNLRLSKTIGLGKKLNPGGSSTGAPQGGGPGGGGGGRGPGGGMIGRPGLGGLFGGSNSDRRYNLTLTIAARNLLNHVNPSAPIGNLSSPFFGESIGLNQFGSPVSAANRRVELQVQFSF